MPNEMQKEALAARAYAVRVLERIERDGHYVGLAADEVPYDAADAREERQATEYVAGITRWKRWLDFLLASYYRGELERMEHLLRQILRLGLYDLLLLETPPHAAINESVALAKRLVRPGAGGLVNGILRNVQRSRDRLPQPEGGSMTERMAVRHSHPTWMVRRWMERFGAEGTKRLLEWNNQRPVFGLRISEDRARMQEQLREIGVASERSRFLDDFLRVRSLQPVIRAGWLASGRCAVQDESAGLIVRLLDPQAGETIIDTCAAPGGKSRYAAQLMEGAGDVLAYDISASRLELLRRATGQREASCIRAEVADLRQLARRTDAPLADRVLLDAPCSGLGVLSKRADLRWNRAEEDLAELQQLQDELLDAAANLVRPGGLLVYGTCTIVREENEKRVEAFLARHPAFILEAAIGHVSPETVTAEGYYATLPHVHEVDGAFGARLRRATAGPE